MPLPTLILSGLAIIAALISFYAYSRRRKSK